MAGRVAAGQQQQEQEHSIHDGDCACQGSVGGMTCMGVSMGSMSEQCADEPKEPPSCSKNSSSCGLVKPICEVIW